MKVVFSTLKKILFWSYERGSLQYDVMCVLILAFIFFAPNSLFHNHRSAAADEQVSRPVVVSKEEVGPHDPARAEQAVSTHIRNKYGKEFQVERIEPTWDGGGNLTGYIVWEK